MSLENKIAAALTALAALLLLAALAHAQEPQAEGIVVRPAAAVEGTEVLVKDVSYPVGRQAQARWLRLKDQPLMPAPVSFGEQQSYPREELARILGQRLGKEARDFVLPMLLVVQRGGAVLNEYDLKLDVVEFLTSRVAGMEGEPVLREYRLPEYVFLSRKGNRLGVEIQGDPEPGRLMLKLREIGPGGPLGSSYSASVFLDVWVSAPCAARPLNTGDKLFPDRVRHERKNLAYMRGEPWDGKNFKLRLKRPVGQGQVIYARDLEAMPVIAEGDEVRLVFLGQYVRLEVPAEAMSDGRIGQTIKVRNLQSERVVTAKVRDGATVTVN
jgi:flagella basal body P-ring formation protein FlgA